MSSDGLCECGCGGITPIAPRNRKGLGWVKGQYIPFIRGHNAQQNKPSPNPSGLCQCGCGRTTSIATETHRGYVKGQHYPYCKGHHGKKPDNEYIVEDCGYTTPCWIFQSRGDNDHNTYGSFHDSDDAKELAHRRFYKQRYGDIPEGLVIDHLCMTKRCVNPDHLEAVTQKENIIRGWSATKQRRISKQQELNQLKDRVQLLERILRREIQGRA